MAMLNNQRVSFISYITYTVGVISNMSWLIARGYRWSIDVGSWYDITDITDIADITDMIIVSGYVWILTDINDEWWVISNI